MTTKKERLLAEAKELGVTGVSARNTEETLAEKIAEAKTANATAALGYDIGGNEAVAKSLPVDVTTEPSEVEANNARFDENHSETGAVAIDPEVLNPGEEVAAGNGKQDLDYTQAARDADKSSPFASVTVTNAEAGIFNETAPIAEERRNSRFKEDHLADKGTGAAGPNESMA